MNLPATYRHDYDYEPPRTPRVYDTPRIVERRPLLGELLAMVRPMLRPVAVRESEWRRRLRLLKRRLNLFDSSRSGVTPQGTTSGPPLDAKGGSRRG